MPKIKKRETSAWIRKVAASHGRKVGEVGYMFVDDEKILEVNNEYLGHDTTTSCIVSSFTASCTCVASTTRARASARSWRRTRTRLSPCSKVLRY